MDYRYLVKTVLKAFALCLGTMMFGGEMDEHGSLIVLMNRDQFHRYR